MNRRDFLRSAGLVSAGLVFPKAGRLLAKNLATDRWRMFEVDRRA